MQIYDFHSKFWMEAPCAPSNTGQTNCLHEGDDPAAHHFHLPGTCQRVNLHYQQKDLHSVLKDIQRQTGMNFIYRHNLLEKTRPITLWRDSIQLGDALQLLTKGQPIRFSLAGSSILEEEISMPQPASDTIPAAVGKIVHGVVYDRADMPLSDVIFVNLRAGGTGSLLT